MPGSTGASEAGRDRSRRSRPSHRKLSLALALLGLLAVAVISYRSLHRAWDFTHPKRERVTAAELAGARSALPSLQEVALHTADGIDLAAWYSPGEKHSVVIFVHGLGSNRAELVPEARLLARHGHGVLLFDSRASGDSTGACASWGDLERRDIRAALDFVLSRPEVAKSAIGLYGFSVGATAAAIFAADEKRIAALALGATWTSLRAELADKLKLRSARLAPLAELVFRGCGADIVAVSPDKVIGRLAPRPLLMMSGSEDSDTPPHVTRELAAHAPEAIVWIIPGAGHGGYMKVDPAGMEQNFASFFDRAFAGSSSAPR